MRLMHVATPRFFRAPLLALACSPFLIHCSPTSGTEDTSLPAAGGALATGGLPASGGSPSGGAVGIGGVSSAAGGTASAGSGGAAATGGGVNSGGTASTGGTVGTGGAASGGAPGSGGGSVAASLFSTDFEGEPVGKIPATGHASWTTTLPTNYDSQGIVEVQSGAGAHSGSNFVYVKKGNDGQAFLQLADPSVFPFAGTTIYVRAYIKVTTWPDNHASWMEVGTVKNEDAEMRFGAHQGVLQVNHWPGDQDQIAEGIKFNAGEWACIEYSYEPGTKTMKVWLNDAPVEALTVVGSFARGGAFDPAPPIEAVRFGAEINTTEAYFDDIAVSDGPIGCQ
jgi:hypothetical protein